MPTNIVIGDSLNSNYHGSALANGYEVPAPSFYDNAIAQQQKYPYQNQTPHPSYGDGGSRHDAGNFQIETWEEWGYDDSTLQVDHTKQPAPEDESIGATPEDNFNFFEDMEPEVKVKKIFVKKKSRTNSDKSNRLSVNEDLDFQTSSELDAWQDQDDVDGWDNDVDVDDIDTAKIEKEAREMRKQERMQKSEEQRRLKLAKKSQQQHENKLATKVS